MEMGLAGKTLDATQNQRCKTDICSLKTMHALICLKGGISNLVQISSDLNNYQPTSHLLFISKIVEQMVATHFQALLHTVAITSFNHFSPLSFTDVGPESLMILQQTLPFGPSSFFLTSRLLLLPAPSPYYWSTKLAQLWFTSYVPNRKHFVQGTIVQSALVTLGTPQGSVLGPYLFMMLYISIICPFQSQGLCLNEHAGHFSKKAESFCASLATDFLGSLNLVGLWVCYSL